MSQARTIGQFAQPQSSRRSWQHPSTVLITGATGGIGAALALSYAENDRTLLLHGRDAARLASVTRDCEMAGAQVHAVTFDLHDAEAAIAELRSLSTRYVIDLAIVNAGVSSAIGKGAEAECWDVAKALLAVNLDGAIATIIAGCALHRCGGGACGPDRARELLVGVLRTTHYADLLREQRRR